MCELFICSKSDPAPEGINRMSNWKRDVVSKCHFLSGNTDGSGPVTNGSEKKPRPNEWFTLTECEREANQWIRRNYSNKGFQQFQ